MSQYSVLVDAAKQGDLSVIEDQLRTIKYIPPYDVRSVAYIVVKDHNIDAIKLLVDQSLGHNVLRFCDEILIQAAKHGSLDIVELIYDLATGYGKRTAMIDAVIHGYIDIVTYLLRSGPIFDINFVCDAAASFGHCNVIRLLHDQGADINFIDNVALLHATAGGHVDAVRLLLECGMRIHNFALLKAVRQGYIDIVQLLIDAGANIHDHDYLSVAAKSNRSHIVNLLIAAGATRDEITKALVDLDIQEKYLNIVEILILNGADARAQLENAVATRSTKMCQLLMRHIVEIPEEMMTFGVINMAHRLLNEGYWHPSFARVKELVNHYNRTDKLVTEEVGDASAFRVFVDVFSGN